MSVVGVKAQQEEMGGESPRRNVFANNSAPTGCQTQGDGSPLEQGGTKSSTASLSGKSDGVRRASVTHTGGQAGALQLHVYVHVCSGAV